MNIKERLRIASNVVNETGLVDDITSDELAEISSQLDIQTKDFSKLAGTIVYFRKRFIEKAGRTDAFKKAFPDRCVPSGYEGYIPYQCSNNEEISKSAIQIKAKRLEQSKIYRSVVTLLTTSLHVAYAMDRYRVLDRLLDDIMDDSISPRDLAALSKVFLEETRKPEKSGDLEVNVNIQNNEVNLVSIDEKLDRIAGSLEGKPASQVIDFLNVEKLNTEESA